MKVWVDWCDGDDLGGRKRCAPTDDLFVVMETWQQILSEIIEIQSGGGFRPGNKLRISLGIDAIALSFVVRNRESVFGVLSNNTKNLTNPLKEAKDS